MLHQFQVLYLIGSNYSYPLAVICSSKAYADLHRYRHPKCAITHTVLCEELFLK